MLTLVPFGTSHHSPHLPGVSQGATAWWISEGNPVIMAAELVSGVFDGEILLTFR